MEEETREEEFSREKDRVMTTLNRTLKAEMIAAGLSFSTALTIGCQELLSRRDGRSLTDQLKSLRKSFVALANAARDNGLNVAEIISNNKEGE